MVVLGSVLAHSNIRFDFLGPLLVVGADDVIEVVSLHLLDVWSGLLTVTPSGLLVFRELEYLVFCLRTVFYLLQLLRPYGLAPDALLRGHNLLDQRDTESAVNLSPFLLWRLHVVVRHRGVVFRVLVSPVALGRQGLGSVHSALFYLFGLFDLLLLFLLLLLGPVVVIAIEQVLDGVSPE